MYVMVLLHEMNKLLIFISCFSNITQDVVIKFFLQGLVLLYSCVTNTMLLFIICAISFVVRKISIEKTVKTDAKDFEFVIEKGKFFLQLGKCMSMFIHRV